ncbi:hypothetical protein SD71_20395 [Cohnella kolymensis]|uniref:Uncharacterized protein n=1 Tax=Cohnella kolymensis TaxID=1590652 RepID=A0ABR5A064_9BACL|nr:hypothetical protein [Cohnella kolymensis]KIL34385.1 hypothetical protein SD71_20395 [Cohnella kolymensis]
MTINEWIAVCTACLYGVITASGSVMQISRKMIPLWSASGMLIGGMYLLAVGVLIIANPLAEILMLPGLVLLHVLAVVNGFHMHGRINLSHHIIRLVLSSIIAILLLV